MKFNDFVPWWTSRLAGASFWRGFISAFAVYYAVMAFRAGLRGDMLWFDADSLLSGVYWFSVAKSHSQVQWLRRRRRYND